jgi:hypothetical protein
MPSQSGGNDPRTRRLKALKLRFGAVAARTVHSFTLPRFPPRLLINELGIARSTLANWLTGKIFELDADKDRKDKRFSRLFSARDAVLLSAAAQLTAIGAPHAVSKFVAEMIAAEIVSSIGGPQLRIPSLEWVIFRRTNTWWLIPRISLNAPKGTQLPPIEIAAKVFASGEWKDVAIDGDLPDAPPVHIVFDLVNFSRHVLGQLGTTIIPAMPKDFRRTAES